MISYQWDAQKRMLKLRDELKRNGYDVWMDVEAMGKREIVNAEIKFALACSVIPELTSL